MNKTFLDFLNEDYEEDFSWRDLGQIYGVFSKFAFLASKYEDEISEDEFDAFFEAAEDFGDNKTNVEALKVILNVIERFGSTYKIDRLHNDCKKQEIRRAIDKVVQMIQEYADED